jgi:aminoglycoside/choline kinase family phosphotransferase
MTVRPQPTEVAWADPQRRSDFERWLAPLAAKHDLNTRSLRAASADASFRRYLRIDCVQGSSLIVMDAPPPHEDVRPFVKIAGLIGAAGLHGPEVLASDVERGFLLLTDLGRTLYLDAFAAADARRADTLMRDAIGALVQWQRHVPGSELPAYDEAKLRGEMQLFPDWCVAREYGVTWGERELLAWQRVSDALAAAALAQPRVAVHRDWMARNLMLSDPNPAILDFQDAAHGPIAYDLASLLRDAFWSWDEEREIDWAARYWEQARRAALPVGDDFGEFWRSVEWIGLQRHLKVLGIFCRLKHRDHKPKYAADLPRFFAYATKVATRYRELAPLLPLIEPLSGMKAAPAYSMR